jgi:hypothetical protein
MRLRAPFAMLGVALLTSAAGGADTGAPLESTRQELRKLTGGQKTSSGPSATEGLRPSLPAIQTPGQDPLPSLPVADPEKLEKERKRQKGERKNWLVNGVEQLERKDRLQEAKGFVGDEDKTDGNNTGSQDGADPQYLLKLYDEQKEIEEAHRPEAKSQRSLQADPLAPFLQGWLGNSPARGQFFDEFIRKPENAANAGSSFSPVAGASHDITTAPVQLTRDPAQDLAAKPNPYLTELSLPMANDPVRNVASMQNTLNPVVAGPSFDKPLIPQTVTPPEARQADRKALPSPLAEDKKYFPQLKKF